MFRRVNEDTKEYEYSKSIAKAGPYDIPINFKDCKGNEIYINDVLLYESNKEKIYGKVEYEGPEPIIKANDGVTYYLKDYGRINLPFEVIGSIHFINGKYRPLATNFYKIKYLNMLIRDIEDKREQKIKENKVNITPAVLSALDKREQKIKENLQNKNLTNLIKQLQEIISIIEKAKECTDPKIKEILIDYCNERIEKLQPKG